MSRVPSVVRIGLAVVAVDLVTKLAAARLVRHTFGPIVPMHNPAFSLGVASAPRVIMLVLAAATLVAASLFARRQMVRHALPAWVPAFVIGGAAANLIDRAAFGAVHDFFVVPPVVLNVADVAVFAGLIGYACVMHRPTSAASPTRTSIP